MKCVLRKEFEMEKLKGREQWGSKLAFILAAAGSAVGLGNIWRFPYLAGDNGGAAFLIIYLACILIIGYPLMNTEFAIGRATGKNPIGAFKALAPNTPWWLVGALAVLAPFVILSYYSVVAGWSVAYIFKALAGLAPTTDYTNVFVSHITSVWEPIIWHFIFMGITIAIIAAGVVSGLQKVAKALMPLLFLILVVLAVRGITLPGSGEGLSFYLKPDFSKVDGGTFLDAVGQAFFSLSLGMGAMITYGSYLSKKESITSSTGWVVGLDTLAAFLAGFAIFPAVFVYGFSPGSGAGLAFMTLPAVFANMPAGSFFGALFFVLLSIAALTSAMSLLEVVAAWVIDEKGWSRKKAALIIGAVVFVFGLPSTLGYSVMSGIKPLGLDLLDFYDFVANAIFLPLGGILTAVFAAFIWKTKNALQEINEPKGSFSFGNWYGTLVGVIIPVVVGIIMIAGLYKQFVG